MARYSAAEVAPVALLVPIFASVFAWLIFGTGNTAGQTIGMALILLGLLVNTFSKRIQATLLRRRT
jgi:O-acetylserine/cysteine efflux transporter